MFITIICLKIHILLVIFERKNVLLEQVFEQTPLYKKDYMLELKIKIYIKILERNVIGITLKLYTY